MISNMILKYLSTTKRSVNRRFFQDFPVHRCQCLAGVLYLRFQSAFSEKINPAVFWRINLLNCTKIIVMNKSIFATLYELTRISKMHIGKLVTELISCLDILESFLILTFSPKTPFTALSKDSYEFILYITPLILMSLQQIQYSLL